MSADLLEQSLERVLEERCGPEVRQKAEATGWPGDLWETLSDSGLVFVSVPEAAGGAGGGLGDAAVVCRLAGRYAVPLPVAECTMLGGWLIGAAGLQLPPGAFSLAAPHPGDGLALDRSGSGFTVSGRLGRVPFGTHVGHVVSLAIGDDGPYVVVLDVADATVTPGKNLAGEPRDALSFDRATVGEGQLGTASPAMSTELELRGALSRCLLMGGAMESVAEMTIAYADARHQFGRTISSFQAVAQRLVLLASDTELAVLSAVTAVEDFVAHGVDAAFEVAAAKATASRAATAVAAHAHQVHAAIGMTQEYPLHQFTRRLFSWRQEWGSQGSWARALGKQVATIGAVGLWPRIAPGASRDTE